MKKRLLSIIITVVIILIILIVITNSIDHNSKYYDYQQNISQVCVKDNCFKVKLALTESERQKGLMYTTNLSEDSGMLFIFQEESIHPFWMKNTLIPLDMIWVNSNDEVVFIKNNAQPCNETCKNIVPNSSSTYTLEINAGLAEKYNISVGNKLIFPNL